MRSLSESCESTYISEIEQVEKLKNERQSMTQLPFAISKNDQIGLVRSRCNDNNIHDIRLIAAWHHHLKHLQAENGTWCYDIFTENGSDSSGTVVNHITGHTTDCVIWPINHYLGLNRHPSVIAAAKDALNNYGAGCGTSGMSGGHNRLHKSLEEKLAKSLGKESTLLFSTGYSANVGALAGLAKGANNLILIDRDAHASLIDGCKLAGCKYLPFKHNSIEDVQRKLEKYSQKFNNVFVVVESVYSMTGNHAPLLEIARLREQYGFMLFVDEAHAFGIYGISGGGRCHELGISEQVDFVMTTLSKATGSIGGVVATSKEFKTLLQVSANAYLFQAALPPADTAAVLAALEIIESDSSIVKSLWHKTRLFRTALKDMGFDIGTGLSPIVPLYVRDSDILMSMGRELLEYGVFTTSVSYPAVHHKEVRFRFIMNASHTEEEIDKTLTVLRHLGKKYQLIQ